MGSITYKEILKCFLYITIVNLAFTLLLFTWATDDDLNNIPKPPFSRFISLFYYSITTFTTTGYGDIYAKSNKMKIIVSLYMIFVFSITVSFLFKI